jgi:hypothetical protein
MEQAWRQEFVRALKVVQWDSSTVKSVARDPEATSGAVLWIALATLAGAAGSVIFPIDYKGVRYQPTILEAFGQAFFSFALIVGVLYAVHFVGNRLFKGRVAFGPFFRVLGYGYVVGLLSIFPILGFLVALWILFFTVKTLQTIDGLKPQQAIFSVLLTVMAVTVVFFLAMGLNPGALYGGFYLIPY